MYIMAIKTSASLLLCPTLTGKTAAGTSKITVCGAEVYPFYLHCVLRKLALQ
jgi:hypothetical protein